MNGWHAPSVATRRKAALPGSDVRAYRVAAVAQAFEKVLEREQPPGER
jgi:hypothetical protein